MPAKKRTNKKKEQEVAVGDGTEMEDEVMATVAASVPDEQISFDEETAAVLHDVNGPSDSNNPDNTVELAALAAQIQTQAPPTPSIINILGLLQETIAAATVNASPRPVVGSQITAVTPLSGVAADPNRRFSSVASYSRRSPAPHHRSRSPSASRASSVASYSRRSPAPRHRSRSPSRSRSRSPSRVPGSPTRSRTPPHRRSSSPRTGSKHPRDEGHGDDEESEEPSSKKAKPSTGFSGPIATLPPSVVKGLEEYKKHGDVGSGKSSVPTTSAEYQRLKDAAIANGKAAGRGKGAPPPTKQGNGGFAVPQGIPNSSQKFGPKRGLAPPLTPRIARPEVPEGIMSTPMAGAIARRSLPPSFLAVSPAAMSAKNGPMADQLPPIPTSSSSAAPSHLAHPQQQTQMAPPPPPPAPLPHLPTVKPPYYIPFEATLPESTEMEAAFTAAIAQQMRGSLEASLINCCKRTAELAVKMYRLQSRHYDMDVRNKDFAPGAYVLQDTMRWGDDIQLFKSAADDAVSNLHTATRNASASIIDQSQYKQHPEYLLRMLSISMQKNFVPRR